MATKTLEFWQGQEGREYVQRNPATTGELAALYKEEYGLTRKEMNQRFLRGLPRDIRILEVGCNIGLQLMQLREMGFKNLTGIDVVEFDHPDWEFKVGTAQALPFEDESFDLVFTSGVLIHIPASELKKVMGEICRVTKRWVWLFEYWDSKRRAIPYRGQDDKLWADNFSFMFRGRFGLRYKDFEFYENREAKYSEMAMMEKPWKN